MTVYDTGLKTSEAAEVLRHRDQAGPAYLQVRNTGDAGLLLGLQRGTGSSLTPIASESDTRYHRAKSGYNGDGSTVSFSGESLSGPVAPKSLVVKETTGSPELQDEDGSGVLWAQDVGARIQGSGATFATMAGESFGVIVDEGGVEQTITMGTEATIAAAITEINSQLLGATASAVDANNVQITSNQTGQGSSITILNVDAGITTKIGLSAGTETTQAGSVSHSSGALTLSYPGGRAPAAASVAQVVGSETATFEMEPGDTLVIDTDANGDETVTFDAGPAVVTGTGGAAAAMANEEMDVIVDGDTQHVTFATEATQALAIATINAALTGAFAESVDANNIKITSTRKGTGVNIQTDNVDAGITTKLGIADAADEDGTGDVADIDNVTAAEAAALIEADTTDLTAVANADGSVTLQAATSINVKTTGTLQATFGFTTGLVGVTDSENPILVDYVSTSALASGESDMLRIPALPRDEELVVHGIALLAPTRVKVDVIQQKL